MPAPRINIAWIVVGVLIMIALFFAYHIGRTMYNNASTNSNEQKIIEEETNSARSLTQSQYGEGVQAQTTTSEFAEPSDRTEPGHQMPQIVGQTEEDITNPDPLQQKAPAYRYNKAQPRDVHTGQPHMEAEFGDNIRHPESMFEARAPQQTSYIPSSGVGSHNSSPGAHDAIAYDNENAQNAGEFMQGIFAFDNSFEGSAYSAI
jgi:FtsZ-interacting cell division protein ZipA